jgi:Domain of unknown function (DUF6468)
MSGIQWVLEFALLVLLLATTIHAIRLERAISVFRKDRTALGDILALITTTLAEAETGIDTLKRAAFGAGQGLTAEIGEANQAAADLRLLLERVEAAFDRGETALRALRSAPPAAPPIGGQGGAAGMSQAERDLLRALKLSK